MRRYLLSVTATILVSLSLRAQHAETIRVEVVDVPVYVTRGEEAVAGLTRNDFELFVDGKAQPIEYFDEIAPGAAATPEDDRRQRRLFLFVFDLHFSRPHAIGRAQKAADAMIRGGGAADLYAVATFSASKGVQFVVPFTSDRVALRRAIRALRPSASPDPLRLTITSDERAAWIAAGPHGEDGSDASPAPAAGGESLDIPTGEASRDVLMQPARRIIENQVLELTDLGARLSQLQGSKHVVVLSEGFDASLVHGTRKSRQRGAPAVSPDLLRRFDTMYRQFGAAGTFLHAVDIAGLRHGFDPATTETPLDALHMLTSGTGGQFVRNTNDLSTALHDLVQSQRHFYLLGFRWRNAKRAHYRIEVRVKGVPRGTQVSYRKGFSTDAAGSNIDPLLLADIVLNDVPQTGPACSLAPAAEGITITIPASAVMGRERGAAAEVMLYVFDATGSAVAFRHLRVVPVAGKDATFSVPLDLPHGMYTAKAILRVGESIGVSKMELTSTTASAHEQQ